MKNLYFRFILAFLICGLSILSVGYIADFVKPEDFLNKTIIVFSMLGGITIASGAVVWAAVSWYTHEDT